MKVREKDEKKILLMRGGKEGGKEGRRGVSVSSRETTALSSTDKPEELRLQCLTAVFYSQLRTDVQGDQTKSCLYQFPFLKALEWQCDHCDYAATQACRHIKVEPGSTDNCHHLN